MRKAPKRKKKAARSTRRESQVKAPKAPVERRASRGSAEWMAGLYRPIKSPVTLRLDADIIAWFKAKGRGYQTRINSTLRKLMMEAKKPRARR
jgi:uncharacterized protein (DUF4415 family)